MDWSTAINGLVGALAAGLVLAAPAVYKLLSGKAMTDRQTRRDLIAAHERLEASLQERLDTYRDAIDALQADVRRLEHANGECEARCLALQQQLTALQSGGQAPIPQAPHP